MPGVPEMPSGTSGVLFTRPGRKLPKEVVMRYIAIQNINKPVSVIGLGTMIFSPEKRDLSFSILDAFLAAGGTFIDTAEIYGDPEQYGYSETTIGLWLQQRGCREQVILQSKGCIPDTGDIRILSIGHILPLSCDYREK